MINFTISEVIRSGFNPIRKYFPAVRYQVARYNTELMDILQVSLDKYRKTHSWENESTATELLGYLLRCKNDDGERDSDEQIKAEMFGMLVAGN